MEMSKTALAIISLVSLGLIVHHAHGQDSPQDFLNAHNAARASVGVGPMIWDDTVAAFARSYINGLTGICILVHSSGPYGENLAWGSANLAGTAAVKMWVDEWVYYNYDSNSCVGGQCLHYTQVVWRNSVRLGCAKVTCDNGSAFAGSQILLFGEIATQIKLVPDHSAGIVAASCVILPLHRTNLTALRFEFLGNVSGQPYILQTNFYADANDDREERIYLWLDPTKALHSYSVLWNLHQTVFMVDWIPIRVYRNHADKGVAYPRLQPSSIKVSLWKGDSWATRVEKTKLIGQKVPS
ncbi:hypothetical protein SADUNF_Sadunf16G0172900 [Salix dunnii]|uniref:GH16 domain-containing protein n=1 Tax=Salix dunnii TaxID=1413687 RepID=A0A835MH85_9ROSI|nr:hypothetical protein SADUNF_Sadunf16G0172900 [Salix dunnii]